LREAAAVFGLLAERDGLWGDRGVEASGIIGVPSGGPSTGLASERTGIAPSGELAASVLGKEEVSVAVPEESHRLARTAAKAPAATNAVPITTERFFPGTGEPVGGDAATGRVVP